VLAYLRLKLDVADVWPTGWADALHEEASTPTP
jgi:hypothetical protein